MNSVREGGFTWHLIKDSCRCKFIVAAIRELKKKCSFENVLSSESRMTVLSAFPSTVFLHPSGIVEPGGSTFLIMLMCYKACLFFHSLICSCGIRRYRPCTHSEVVHSAYQHKACGGGSNAQPGKVAQLNTKPFPVLQFPALCTHMHIKLQ